MRGAGRLRRTVMAMTALALALGLTARESREQLFKIEPALAARLRTVLLD